MEESSLLRELLQDLELHGHSAHKDMIVVEELRGTQLPGSVLFVEFVTHNQAVTRQCGHSAQACVRVTHNRSSWGCKVHG